MPSKLNEAIGALKDAFVDLASLEVQTYTGSIDITKLKDKEGKDIDVTKFESYLKASIGQPENLKLVAVTKMNCDGDAINLVPEAGFDGHVQRVHESALKAGIETRHGIMALFSSALGVSKG
ncbi:MAG: hypothetical protein Q9M17_04960 [Mariprofundus sp.]|nr:hypothetical protein [Mariprofundus sp.]